MVKYDEKGNMTYGPVDGVMQELTYDCRNRLVEAGGVSYTYDAENTRIATTEDGLTTEYVTDIGGSLSKLLVAYEADNTETTYYYGAEGLAAQYNSGTGKYYAYHYDNIGSTTLITAKDGHAVERFSYGTYGELLKAPITRIRFLYNGSYGVATDSNGLYYMRARYYNPDIKRFINQDIKVGDIGSSQSLNRYAYCEGNPVSMVDPFGLCGEDANDQGKTSKYEKWHNFLGIAGIFWDGFDLINGALYAAEGDYVNAAISFACGIPAVGNIVAGVAKTSKAVKAIKTAEKIADACKAVGKAGNTAAGMKATYDTYQTAQRECKTTTGKIAYMAGTMIAGYLTGKAANWGASKLKNLANKALPKLKTAVQEGAGKLASRFSKGFGTSGSGRMNRNRGFVVNPFYKGGNSSIPTQQQMHDAVTQWARMEESLANSNTQLSRFNTASVVYDSATGNYYYGMNRGVQLSGDDLNSSLKSWLPEKSLNDYKLGNCAEVDAINQALNSGANVDGLYMYTINTKTNLPKPMCENCSYTFWGRVADVFSK